MSISEQAIRDKIKLRREAIQKLDRERERLLHDILAYEELLTEFASSSLISLNGDGLPDPLQTIQDNDGADGRLSRGLSRPWKATMKRLSKEATFNYDDVVAAASKSEMDIEKSTARTRIFRYIEAGYVERIEEGLFALTKKGREAAE